MCKGLFFFLMYLKIILEDLNLSFVRFVELFDRKLRIVELVLFVGCLIIIRVFDINCIGENLVFLKINLLCVILLK